jgi:hypothetical protein
MSNSEFLHEGSRSIRFWVSIDGALVGASVSSETLRFSYAPQAPTQDPLVTFRANIAGLEEAVRRRVAKGSIEPVMLREFDLRVAPKSDERTS